MSDDVAQRENLIFGGQPARYGAPVPVCVRVRTGNWEAESPRRKRLLKESDDCPDLVSR